MKKFFFILYGVIVLIAIIASVYLYTHQVPVSQTPTPPASEEPGPLYVYSANGEKGPLLDPIKDAVQIDETTGNAVLTEKPDYILEYFAQDHTFNITLLGNNLRESRLAAERDLLDRFQITEEQACSLNVMVGTIVSVSQQFSGQPLGLSFCPGRVDLPTSVNDPMAPGSSTSTQPDTRL